VFFGLQLGMASISILAVVLLFMFRVVEWKDLQERMEWGVILMYGGAIAISSILNSTGAGLWFTKQYVLPHLDSPWMLMLALIYRCIYAVAGGYITATLAPNKPMLHAIILGVIGIVASAFGAIAAWNLSAHWYPIALVITALPCTWLGGKLKTKKQATTIPV
jgi:di/tricarboxylate transporter